MGQLILQTGGRAGRTDKTGTVLIQTHQPDTRFSPAFYRKAILPLQKLLAERQSAMLPPFSYFALLRAEAPRMETALHFLETIKNCREMTQVHLLGPIPAPMPRRAARHRAQLLLQSQSRPALHALLKILMPQIETLRTGHALRWSLDVDPMEMI